MRIRAGVGALKLRRYMLQRQVSTEIFERFQYVIPTDDTLPEIEQLIGQVEFKTDCPEYPASMQWRIERMIHTCHPNPVACTAIELSCLEYAEPSIDDLLSLLFPGHKHGIRLLEALKITYPYDEYAAHMPELVECTKILPLFLHIDSQSSELLFTEYRADSVLSSFLAGGHWAPPVLQNSFKLVSPDSPLDPVILHQSAVSKITVFIRHFFASEQAVRFPIVQLTGSSLTGKRFIVRHCAKSLGLYTIFIQFDQFFDCVEGDFTLKTESLIREAAMFGAAVCLHGISFSNPIFRHRFIQLLTQWPVCTPFFLTSSEQINLTSDLENPIFSFSMPKNTYMDNLNLWNEMARLYLTNQNFNAVELADKLPLPVGMIKKVVQAIALSPQEYATVSDISKLCFSMLETEPVPSLKRVQTSYTMDQLKLDKPLKDSIQAICNQILNRMQVFDVWKMRQLYPYGRCVSALLTGPPGTGKTMAASVIANTVNLELYRVDLSQLMDKYIGETEKRLETVFAHAERSNCILFFDEADAVFGKRSEVNDSKDRFANTQISYLLQRIEEYDGVVIMASNYRNNIDSAFTRRISYVLDFSNPNKSIRKEIWESLFLDTMEFEDIDFEFLAEHFEITGAMIKNIVLKAAFFAVSQKQPISMTHIFMALIQEYNKIGLSIRKEDLGEYGYFLSRDLDI